MVEDGCEVLTFDHGTPLNRRDEETHDIRKLAETIGATVGSSGRLILYTSKPDGTLCKLFDISQLRALGWEVRILFVSIWSGLPGLPARCQRGMVR